jgi:hypothetical protein
LLDALYQSLAQQVSLTFMYLRSAHRDETLARGLQRNAAEFSEFFTPRYGLQLSQQIYALLEQRITLYNNPSALAANSAALARTLASYHSTPSLTGPRIQQLVDQTTGLLMRAAGANGDQSLALLRQANQRAFELAQYLFVQFIN